MIIEYHPKLVARLARIYINKHFKEGPAASKEWASRIIGEDKELEKRIAEWIRDNNKKR